MRKNGFTLVELLAVIVILALIALITIPVILNVVEKSKTKTYQRSIDAYGGAVNKAIAEYLLDYEDNTSKKLKYSDIQGYIKYEGNKVECETFEIYKDKTVYLADCKVNSEVVDYTYGIYQEKFATLLSDADNNNKVSIGDKYKYKVNSENEFDFYVLSVEGDKANLIMDRNICENGNPTDKTHQCNYVWYSEPEISYGPLTIMIKLGNATRNWINVPNMNLEYNDEQEIKEFNILYPSYLPVSSGYSKLKVVDGIGVIIKKDGKTQIPINLVDNMPLKARLPKLSEVMSNEIGCQTWKTVGYGSCPAWLIENLYYPNDLNVYCNICITKYEINKNNGLTNVYGYWLLSSYKEYSNSVLRIGCSGSIVNETPDYADISGMRPVISVPISDLE